VGIYFSLNILSGHFFLYDIVINNGAVSWFYQRYYNLFNFIKIKMHIKAT